MWLFKTNPRIVNKFLSVACLSLSSVLLFTGQWFKTKVVGDMIITANLSIAVQK